MDGKGFLGGGTGAVREQTLFLVVNTSTLFEKDAACPLSSSHRQELMHINSALKEQKELAVSITMSSSPVLGNSSVPCKIKSDLQGYKNEHHNIIVKVTNSRKY